MTTRLTLDSEAQMREGMGVVGRLDYAREGSSFDERLTRCYELAVKAVFPYVGSASLPKSLPVPVAVVHGSWHGPDAPRRIDHAWILLHHEESGESFVWEPITSWICREEMFNDYTDAQIHYIYGPKQALRAMMSEQTYGPWA